MASARSASATTSSPGCRRRCCCRRIPPTGYKPEQGFAFQGIYTKHRDLDVSIRARNHDLVLVPRGYHVVSAAPGYDCYYLNAMAGAVREWLFTTDPDHEWLMDWKKS